MSWLKPANEGGTPVLDYTILYDNGSSGAAFIVLEENVFETTYTAVSLTPGINYMFKIQARNAYGLSSASTALTVLTAQKPDNPEAPFTIVEG